MMFPSWGNEMWIHFMEMFMLKKVVPLVVSGLILTSPTFMMAGQFLPSKGLHGEHFYSHYKRESRGPLLNYVKFIKNKKIERELVALLMGDDRDAAIQGMSSILLDLGTLSTVTFEYLDTKIIRIMDGENSFYEKDHKFVRVVEIDQADMKKITNFVDKCLTIEEDGMRYQKDKIIAYQLTHFIKDEMSKLRGVRYRL